jgi:hypothetical protein
LWVCGHFRWIDDCNGLVEMGYSGIDTLIVRRTLEGGSSIVYDSAGKVAKALGYLVSTP